MYWIFMEKRMAAPRFCFTVTHKLPATGNACTANAPFGFGLRLSACFPTALKDGMHYGERGGSEQVPELCEQVPELCEQVLELCEQVLELWEQVPELCEQSPEL
ncbi:hypothetical protein MR642_08055 [bacterium]|nr:hypothetical protein [bacterium]